MWNHRDVVFVLDGSSYGNRTRTTAYTLALHESVAQILVNILTAVSGDVYVSRIELLQLVYGGEQSFRPIPFDGWKNLKRERGSLIAVDGIYNAHAL